MVDKIECGVFDIERQLELRDADLTRKNDEKDVQLNFHAANICKLYIRGTCGLGPSCRRPHKINGEYAIVCKHYIRGLCKKGSSCDYLHRLDQNRMPECTFFAQYGMCNNADCQFQHIRHDEKHIECPWYNRGFCPRGKNCKKRHIQATLCTNYLAGFCPDGPNCRYKHPKYELTKEMEDELTRLRFQPDYTHKIRGLLSNTCSNCGMLGHQQANCPARSHFDD
eukprot:TRINITY_DN3791_c0_g1_i1.p1 TRINITY_DN3791_c0_g1~~TRINITY_DN3791_c0_g1_i1.p1  ORF type:complete len:224 (+),score=30.47 TRINITY_DN3791_c0_g1_i1:75-746(+)